MNPKRIRVAVFQGTKLPFAPIKVQRAENGERIIEGVTAFVDSFPDLPFGRKDAHGNWVAYTRAEREAIGMALKAKAERAAKRAMKAGKEKLEVVQKVKNFREAMNHIASTQVGTVETKSFTEPTTVKRDGKWIQVGSDNLTAHIEAR